MEIIPLRLQVGLSKQAAVDDSCDKEKGQVKTKILWPVLQMQAEQHTPSISPLKLYESTDKRRSRETE